MRWVMSCVIRCVTVLFAGGMEPGVQGEHLDDIFSAVLSHDVMASDMPLTFTGPHSRTRDTHKHVTLTNT